MKHVKRKYVVLTDHSLVGVKAETRDGIDRFQAMDLLRQSGVLAVIPDLPVGGFNTDTKIKDKDYGESVFNAGDLADSVVNGYTGEGVKVALLDYGVNQSHAAFTDNAFSKSDSRNFTSEGTSGDVTDRTGHGTYCAGILLGQAVGGQKIGVAPGITEAIVCKVLEENGSVEAIIQALLWAKSRGAQIISMPLEYLIVQQIFEGYRSLLNNSEKDARVFISEKLEDYFMYIQGFNQIFHTLMEQSNAGEGCLVVSAAGNGSDHETGVSLFVSHPARLDWILSVGCFQKFVRKYKVYRSSNYGFDIGAPGFRLQSADLVVDSSLRNTTNDNNEALTYNSGTSGATSYVAGVAALWAQKLMEESGDGKLDINQLRNSLLENANFSKLDNRFATTKRAGHGIVMPPPQR